MAPRFNPPPGWPVPPAGWLPEPGWQPDASWPPAPAGWQFYVEDAAAPPPPAPATMVLPAAGPPPAPSYLGATPPAPPPSQVPSGSPVMAGSAGARPNWFVRHKVLTGAGATVLLLGGIGAVSNGGGAGSTPSSAGASKSASTSAAPTSPAAKPPASPSSAPAATTSSSSAPAAPSTPAPAKPVTYQGRGDKVLSIKKPETGAVLLTATHKGSANFAVESLDTSLQEQDLLVNTIGRYSGTTLLDKSGEETAKLKITASGTWKVVIKPLLSAPSFSGSTKGNGDAVVIYTGPVGTAKLTHKGQENFAVWAYGESSSDLLVNEIGNYSGENVMPEGPVVLAITADGSWTVAVSG